MHGLVVGQDPRQRRGDLEQKLENPLGFFESERLVEINDALLQVLFCKWDRPPLLPSSWDQDPLLDAIQVHRRSLASYSLDHAWVDKDPRLCITYPAYLHILLRRIPLAVALRSPLAVATSLHARNGFSLNRGLVLWWIYNHHIASQLCPTDLLVPYSSLLILEDQDLQRLFGPFLESHKHQRPSNDETSSLIASLLKPEFNRSETALNSVSRAHIHPMLLKICERAYTNVTQAGDQLTTFQDNFSCLPRVVLEFSARDQLVPEADISLLQNRLHIMSSDISELSSNLDLCEQECLSNKNYLNALWSSRSWKLTKPLRSLSGFCKSLFSH